MSQEKILAQSKRGMSQIQLERIYGRDLVRSILSPLRPASPPTPRPFDRRLCDCRVSLKMTILEFARFTGIASAALTAYEAGRRKPVSPEVIGKLARVMGENVEQLRTDLGMSVPEPEPAPDVDPATDIAAKRRADALARLMENAALRKAARKKGNR